MRMSLTTAANVAPTAARKPRISKSTSPAAVHATPRQMNTTLIIFAARSPQVRVRSTPRRRVVRKIHTGTLDFTTSVNDTDTYRKDTFVKQISAPKRIPIGRNWVTNRRRVRADGWKGEWRICCRRQHRSVSPDKQQLLIM